MRGLPAPAVDNLHSVQVTVPSPLSVAKFAQETPTDEISTLTPSICPPYVACNPLPEDSAVEIIFVPDIVTFPLFVAHIAFPPLALVVIFPPVIETSPP